MPPRKINPKEFIDHLRAGLDDAALMAKYALSPEMLEALFAKLVETNRISQSELNLRRHVTETMFLIRKRVTGETIAMEPAATLAALAEQAVSAGVSLASADLPRANLTRAHLARADLKGADLTEARLSDANLEMADLSGAILFGADLRGANLSNAYLNSADLSSANLTSANISSTDLLNANCTGANLSFAKISRSNAGNCDFTGANLEGADFSYASLSGANLSAANTEGTNFEGVNMMFVTKDRIAAEKAESEARRELFINSPLGVVTLQLAWLVICPLGYLVFGTSVLWGLLMEIALVSIIILNYSVALFQRRGWLLLVFGGFQTLLCFLFSLMVGTTIVN